MGLGPRCVARGVAVGPSDGVAEGGTAGVVVGREVETAGAAVGRTDAWGVGDGGVDVHAQRSRATPTTAATRIAVSRAFGSWRSRRIGR